VVVVGDTLQIVLQAMEFRGEQFHLATVDDVSPRKERESDEENQEGETDHFKLGASTTDGIAAGRQKNSIGNARNQH
jgi:hypothetical protein